MSTEIKISYNGEIQARLVWQGGWELYPVTESKYWETRKVPLSMTGTRTDVIKAAKQSTEYVHNMINKYYGGRV